MTGTDSLKVYELAKELGTDSISLLDKLKKIGIVVKSHMSTLSADQVAQARTGLVEKPPAAKKKKKVAKKRKAATAKKSSSASSSSKIIRRRGTEEAPEVAAVSTAPKKKAIVRRKVGETVTETFSIEEEVRPIEEIQATETENAPSPPSGSTETPQTETLSTDSSAVTGGSSSTSATVETTAPVKIKKPFVPTLRRVSISDTKPNPLKIVKRADKTETSARSSNDASSSKDKKKSPRIIKMNKESLDKMAADEAAKRKQLGSRENIRPEDANFSDYRKKQMIFLPKRKRIPVGKELGKTVLTEKKDSKRVVEVNGKITVSELAGQLQIKARELLRKLMDLGQPSTPNSSVDLDTATLVAQEYRYSVKNVEFQENELLAQDDDDQENDRLTRPPIVTIMGHVDHGKTSLLDAIRLSKVVEGEAGGITQHVGAYTITKDQHEITFIDTPGHEAFTAMRARGANLTDIVVLVVAADDGVMPQTREAINHAKAAGVPIIVAVNKMDKPGANVEKIKQSLAELDLLSEDWGGETIYVPVSAIEKTNLDKLLESIVLTAEMLELKANATIRGEGNVLEARLEKGRGPVATVIVRKGSLKKGDYLVAGKFQGRVRAMIDWTGAQVEELLPGKAAEVLGLEGVPEAGDEFHQTKNDRDAKRIVSSRLEEERKATAATSKMSLDDLFSKLSSGEVKELNAVVKADVYGSLEALKESLTKLSNDQVKVNIVHAATGGITESDILLATASKAFVFGFHVRPEGKARRLAEQEGIQLHCYTIIYELIDDVKKAMTGLLDKKKVENFLGRAEVREVFNVPKLGTVAGTAVIDGKIIRGANVRLLRDSVVVYEGNMTSLKRFKDDAKEVQTGYECGIGIDGFNDFKAGDVIEAYEIEMVSQELNS